MPNMDDRPMTPPPVGPGGPPPDGFMNDRYTDNYYTPLNARRGDDSVTEMGKVNKNVEDNRDLENVNPDDVKYIPNTAKNWAKRARVRREFRKYVKGYNVFRKSIIKKLRKIKSLEDKLEAHKNEPDVAFGRDKINDKLAVLRAKVNDEIAEEKKYGKPKLYADSIALYNKVLYPDSAFEFDASQPYKYNPATEKINNKGFVHNPYLKTNNDAPKNKKKKENTSKKESNKAKEQKVNDTVNNKINNAVKDAEESQKEPERIVKRAYDEFIKKYGKDFYDRHVNGKKENKEIKPTKVENDKYKSVIAKSNDENFKKNISATYDHLLNKYGKEYVERNYKKLAFDNAVIRKYPNLDLGLIEENLYLNDEDNHVAKERFERAYKEVATDALKKKEVLKLGDNQKYIEEKKEEPKKEEKIIEAPKKENKNIVIENSIFEDALTNDDYGISKDAFDELKEEGYKVGSKEFENVAKEFGGHKLSEETVETLEELQKEVSLDKNKNAIKEKGVNDSLAESLAKSGFNSKDDDVIDVVNKLDSNKKEKNTNGSFEDAINDSIEKLETDSEVSNSSIKAEDYGLSEENYKEIIKSGIKPGTEKFNIASKIYGGHNYTKKDKKEKVYDFSKEDELEKFKNLKKELTDALRKAKHDAALNDMLNESEDVKTNNRTK